MASDSSEDLSAFVREALARNVPRERIEAVLIEAGWPREKVAAGEHCFELEVEGSGR